MALSVNEADILEKIVGFGGYVTKEILSLYRNDITVFRCYIILKQLEKKGFIKPRSYFASFREPTVYQVTQKACGYYDRPQAYMRKKHKQVAMRRYLIRSHFFFSLAAQGVKVSLFSSASREDYLIAKGFSTYYLPKKVNKGVESIQIEEYIIDDEAYSKGRTICFVYIDNPIYSVKAQLINLLEKYEKMQKAKIAFLNFRIVTEEDWKSKLYLETYEKYFFKAISMVDVKAESISRNYKSQII